MPDHLECFEFAIAKVLSWVLALILLYLRSVQAHYMWCRRLLMLRFLIWSRHSIAMLVAHAQ
jgi:hypothetical protein